MARRFNRKPPTEEERDARRKADRERIEQAEVILSWDDVAELYTREPLLRNANDFEGYKLFKATDKNLLDAEIITDGYE